MKESSVLPRIWLGHSTDTPATITTFSPLASAPSLFSFGDVIRRPELAQKFVGKIGPKMGFSGPVMLDSGGFTLSKHPQASWTTDKLLESLSQADADLVVSLDFPPWRCDDAQTRLNKIIQTAVSFAQMRACPLGAPLMPVIHGRNLQEIELSCDLTEEAGFKRGPIGLGGMVPILQSTGASTQARNLVIQAVRYVKCRFRSHLHVFGAGSPNTIRALLVAGADSADSIAWRQAAAYGSVYLRGSAQRLLRWERPTRAPRPVVNDLERKLIESCGCPVCGSRESEARVEQLAKSFRARAVHNAFTLLQEFTASQMPSSAGLPSSWMMALEARTGDPPGHQVTNASKRSALKRLRAAL